MRALLATSIGAACTAALALPLALPAGATGATGATGTTAPVRAHGPKVAGSTQSLPLGSLDRPGDRGAPSGARGLPARKVRPFSLAGVVWKDADDVFHGRVQLRTRSTVTDRWSGWKDLQTHNDDIPDKGSAERRGAGVRGSTAPLWVGDSDAVQVRALPKKRANRPDRAGGEDEPPASTLPAGMRLELVDPGAEPAPSQAESASSAVNAQLAPMGATRIKALGRKATEADAVAALDGLRTAGKPRIGPRPGIVTRAGWGADEKLRERNFSYTRTVRTAFVHHSATGNGYGCKQVPSVLRSIYRYHVKSMGWRDFGYNFVIDKCGTIYEGRAGGVARPVMGAHTLGFNANSMGIAVLGTFTKSGPSNAAVNAIAKLSAWKLGLYGANAGGTTTVVSGGSNKYRKGVKVRLRTISGHRDGFVTDCPGGRLYAKIGTARKLAARLQGR